MLVTYSVIESQPEGEIGTPCESMEEALRLADNDDAIWLCEGADGQMLLSLPDSFNRCVNVNGHKINSAVLRRTEVNCDGNTLPLPDEAPMLIIDIDRSEIDWLPKGIGGPVVRFYPPREEGTR